MITLPSCLQSYRRAWRERERQRRAHNCILSSFSTRRRPADLTGAWASQTSNFFKKLLSAHSSRPPPCDRRSAIDFPNLDLGPVLDETCSRRGKVRSSFRVISVKRISRVTLKPSICTNAVICDSVTDFLTFPSLKSWKHQDQQKYENVQKWREGHQRQRSTAVWRGHGGVRGLWSRWSRFCRDGGAAQVSLGLDCLNKLSFLLVGLFWV